MGRISFKLRMYHQVRSGNKFETRRMGGTPFMQGQILLVAHPHIRPKNGPFRPIHLERSLDWVANEGRWAVELSYGPAETEKSVPMGWKCMAGMYLPAGASSHAIKVKETRKEPLEAISEEGAKLEGFSSRAEFLKYVQDMRGKDFVPSTLKAMLPEYDTADWGTGWFNHLPRCMAQAMGVL
jgi:hypothetical protein